MLSFQSSHRKASSRRAVIIVTADGERRRKWRLCGRPPAVAHFERQRFLLLSECGYIDRLAHTAAASRYSKYLLRAGFNYFGFRFVTALV
jgi:hypothetical protein